MSTTTNHGNRIFVGILFIGIAYNTLAFQLGTMFDLITHCVD